MDEQVFFNESGVSVSNSRFIVNGQTYAMNSVTSVKQGETKPESGPEYFIILISVLVVVFGDSLWKIGAALVCAAMIYFIKSKKWTYSVVLNVSSGEMQALRSKDKEYIGKIIEALNQAIVSRG
ncbi:DUF6232 family protein [Chromobacterium haemolyticum]|uniref:DUF6232 family protein n=1 Tax=Chromobacterium haemolyticum TaxID=394935 RepID=UPI000D32847D|nr:DUF6232 family protein [Chromobacterium haemolyticum]PTU70755.1 QacE [Chromobacterium haemolyticum]